MLNILPATALWPVCARLLCRHRAAGLGPPQLYPASLNFCFGRDGRMAACVQVAWRI